MNLQGSGALPKLVLNCCVITDKHTFTEFFPIFGFLWIKHITDLDKKGDNHPLSALLSLATKMTLKCRSD